MSLIRRAFYSRHWLGVCLILLEAAGAGAVVSDVPDPAAGAARPAVFSGLARAAEANLFVGSATTSIDIEVPPGRRSLTPKLALVYNSGQGPSAYGHGWDLPLGLISRSRKHGVLSCEDAAARRDFVVLLPEASVECSLDANASVGWQRCRPPVEEAFLRIDYDASTNSWTVWDKSGLRYRFGEIEPARSGSSTAVGWVGTNPCRYTQSWALTSIDDLHGNQLQIDYERAEGTVYPQRLSYGGNAAQGIAHPFEIRFLWRARAPLDNPFNNSGGYPARLTRLLDAIEIHQSDAARLRSYRMSYDFDGADPAPLGRSSFLTAVTLFGRNGQALSRADGLPAATTFAYQKSRREDRRMEGSSLAWPAAVKALRFEGGSEQHRNLRIDQRDMNGDGILDLVDATACRSGNRQWLVYPGSARGFATTPLAWSTIDVDWACYLSNTDIDGNDADTDHDTLDLNGDGFPDLVDARSEPWQVYLGAPPEGAVGWRFQPVAVAWPALVVTANGVRVHTLRGSDRGRGWVDLIDWNGDGLPDLVNARTARVHINTGAGFETDGQVVSFPESRFRQGGENHTREGLYDMNGDSLPDFVVAAAGASQWQVYLNQGSQLATAPELWDVPVDCADGITSIVDGETERDLVDIDGDGLLDVVDTCGWTVANPYWRVRLNFGAGFRAETIAWRSPLRRIRQESPCEYGSDTRCVFYQTVDGDGDGIADLVEGGGEQRRLYPTSYWLHRNGSGAWRSGCDGACPNPVGGRPELLVLMQNGVGATTTLAYRPSTDWDNTDSSGVTRLPLVLWNLTAITRISSMATIVPGESRLTTRIRYAYGRFDPRMHEFRGFGAVYTVDGSGSQTTTLFKQDAARKGKIEQVRLHAAGADPDSDIPLEVSLSEWSCADPATGVDRSCPTSLAPSERRWVRLRASHRYTYNANGVDDLFYKHSVTQNLAWDAYGNATQVRQTGDNDTPTLDTRTEYAVIDSVGGGGGAYIANLPSHVRIDSNAPSERWFFYDGLGLGQVLRGDVTRRETWLDSSAVPVSACTAGGSRKCVRTELEYDALGNVVASRDTLGRRTTIDFDPLRLYPIRVVNPLGHVVTSEYDYGCGRLTRQSIPGGGAFRRNVYDDFCRLSQTYLPGQRSPQQRVHYYLGAPGVATDILTETAETGSPTGWNEVDDLFDPLGRPLQRLRAASVDGYRTLVADNTVAYDARGAVVSVRSPFSTSYAFGSNGIALYRPAPSNGETRMERDALGRVVRLRNADGGERTFDRRTAWQVTTADECVASDDCAGGRTVETFDAAGRVIEKRSFERAVGGRETLRAGVQYSYDGAGRVVSTMQWDGSRYAPATKIQTSYDSLGRRVAMADPDSGTWKYGYDLAGNLLYEEDPNPGQHVQFCYDAGDRVTRKYVFRDRDFNDTGFACNGTEPPAVTYAYDPPGEVFGAGRLQRVDDESGSTWLEEYDAQGRARRHTRDIRADGVTRRAVVRYQYDRVGHLAAVQYPDGEVVTYGYDEVGGVESLRSADGTVYLANQTYDVAGRVRQTTHGNGDGGVGVIDVREYDVPERQSRLKHLYVVPAAGAASMPACADSGMLLDLEYSSYAANGLLQRIEDRNAACGALTNAAQLTYDGLGRLTKVEGNPLINGSYVYDLLGNLVEKEGRKLSYSTSKPHTLSSVDGVAVGHDRNGNRTGKPGARYAYAPEDRLESVNDGEVSFVYDYTGREAVRRSADGTSLNFHSLADFRTIGGSGVLTKHYFAGPQRMATREVPWAPQILAAAPSSGVTFAGLSPAMPTAISALLDPASRGGVLLFGAAVFGLWLLPERRRRNVGMRVRHGHVLLLGLTFLSSTLPLTPRAAWAGGQGAPRSTPTPTAAPPSYRLLHYHSDHLGSTQLVTDGSGQIVQHIRYRPYGEVRGRWDRQLGSATTAVRHEFTGYESDAAGLQYAGARFYDPALGLFLTQDPARQFPSPYSYGGGDPVNWTDPDGRDFLTAVVVVAIAVAACAGANALMAASRGATLSEIGKAAATGAISGAASIGLGVLLAGANIGVSAVVGTLPEGYGGAAGIASVLGEVAQRSAAGAAASQVAGQTATALGAPDVVAMASSMVAGYMAAYGYDSKYLGSHAESGPLNDADPIQTVSSEVRHRGQTAAAASHVFGDPRDIADLARANVLEDARNVLDPRMLNNENHFGLLARQTADRLKAAAVVLRDSNAPREKFISVLGKASHYVQDQFALGHIFPGTHLLSSGWGAIPRFLVHQTFGGEASFVQGQFNATVDLFRQVAQGAQA